MIQRVWMKVFPIDLDKCRALEVDGQRRTFRLLLVQHFLDVLRGVTWIEEKMS
jgi:hypothetical protein